MGFGVIYRLDPSNRNTSGLLYLYSLKLFWKSCTWMRDLKVLMFQVLFCQLTDEQTEAYKSYLSSKDVASILDGRLKVYVGLLNMRKICNHPDLYTGGPKHFTHVS